jgi:hypothetical protein
MATHRRGLRPSQWPVRDLLGPDDRGRLWDARIGAAVAGLLACGAAVTVVLTSGDTAASDAPVEAPQPGPLALPPPPAGVPAPAVPPVLKMPPPAPVLPAPPMSVVPVPPGAAGVVPAPSPPPRVAPSRPLRSVDRPVSRPRRAPVEVCVPSPTLAEQIAAGIEQRDDRPVAGWLPVPVQRPADAAALLELACRECEPDGGRHRAPGRDDDVERSADRYREGGRHRAPDREDDRSQRHRSGDDRDEGDERHERDGDRAEERRDDPNRDRDSGRDSGRDSDRDEDDRAEQKDERSTPDQDGAGDEAPEDKTSDDAVSDDSGERHDGHARSETDPGESRGESVEHDTDDNHQDDTDRPAKN